MKSKEARTQVPSVICRLWSHESIFLPFWSSDLWQKETSLGPEEAEVVGFGRKRKKCLGGARPFQMLMCPWSRVFAAGKTEGGAEEPLESGPHPHLQLPAQVPALPEWIRTCGGFRPWWGSQNLRRKRKSYVSAPVGHDGATSKLIESSCGIPWVHPRQNYKCTLLKGQKLVNLLFEIISHLQNSCKQSVGTPTYTLSRERWRCDALLPLNTVDFISPKQGCFPTLPEHSHQPQEISITRTLSSGPNIPFKL